MSMMQEDDDNMKGITIMDEEDEIEISKLDFSHIYKHPYLNKVFCWIESGKTEEIKRFFDTFPHMLPNFNSPNNWNPLLFAVRYGNVELIDYFKQKKMPITMTGILNNLSIVHTAVYSGQSAILEYILNTIPEATVNPVNCETSPLKTAMKANNAKMVEVLVSRGAFYIFGDVCNNIDIIANEDQKKYWSPALGKQISQSMVVEENTVRDCSIKETLKYSRVKQLMHMKKYASNALSNGLESSNKFYALASVINNEDYFQIFLKVAVNKGDSILKKASNTADSTIEF